MKKSIDMEDFEELTGPMNSVAKEDALVFAGFSEDTDIDKLEPHDIREVRAKKAKMRKATIKHDRAIAKAANKLF